MAQATVQWVRRSARVIRMVSELHRMGYQRLRLMPYEGPTGYRIWIAPASSFSLVNGAYCPELDEPGVGFSAGTNAAYFDWRDADNDNARQLADKFVERFPRLCELGKGSDWAYAGWLADLLARLEQHSDRLPQFDLTDFVDELPDKLTSLPLRRVPGAGPEKLPGDLLFPLPPIAA